MRWCSIQDIAHDGGLFWQGYRSLIPEDPGWSERNQLYTLYHIINHFNLFGRGYESEAVELMQGIVSGEEDTPHSSKN